MRLLGFVSNDKFLSEFFFRGFRVSRVEFIFLLVKSAKSRGFSNLCNLTSNRSNLSKNFCNLFLNHRNHFTELLTRLVLSIVSKLA